MKFTLTRMSHKSSAVLRYTGTGADFVGFTFSQGVDPASPANLLETRASTRSPFARDEFCETCGLILVILFVALSSDSLKAINKPNEIVIMADDIGY